MSGKLSESRLKETLGALNAHWTTKPLAEVLKAHIDALTADLAAATAENERLRKALEKQEHEIQQTLGRVLGYPRFCDDQKNFPGTTDADGVCVGEHVAETLAAEAAARLAAAQQRLAELAVDPAKREELVTKCYEKLTGHYKSVVNCTLSDWSNQFQAGLTAAVEHAFSLGRASRPEVAELQRQLDEANKRLAELTKPADEEEAESLARLLRETEATRSLNVSPYEKMSPYNQETYRLCASVLAARVRADHPQQIAELKEKLEAAETNVNRLTLYVKEEGERLRADRDRLAAELALYEEACGQLSDLVDLLSEKLAIANKFRSRYELVIDGLIPALVSICSFKGLFKGAWEDNVEMPGKLVGWVVKEWKRLAAELSATKQALADARGGVERVRKQYDFIKQEVTAVYCVLEDGGGSIQWAYRTLRNVLEYLAEDEANDKQPAPPTAPANRAASEPDEDSGEASEKVEPAERRFVCPRCDGTKLAGETCRAITRSEPLICEDCGHHCTWAEVEAAKGEGVSSDDQAYRELSDIVTAIQNPSKTISELRQRAERAEAAEGVMRKALEQASSPSFSLSIGGSSYPTCPVCNQRNFGAGKIEHAADCVVGKSLATDAGATLLAEVERLRKFERAVRDFDESEEDDSPMPRAIGKALEELDQAAHAAEAK